MPFQGEANASNTLSALLAGYRPLPGVPDELLAADGTLRPVWRDLAHVIASMSPEELAARRARGDQYLRDAGVFYRKYDSRQGADRDWPLSHMPVLIDEDEWSGIALGLMQRADILERFVRDLYGDNRLVADGHLPASLVAGNPEWLRPMVGVEPRGGHFLHHIAFDIARGPEGNWWVLCDRTQAPSGAGFALENRIATTRVFTEHYSNHNVKRLAGFFRTFKESLVGMREGDDSRPAILTPGPMNETFYEHAYVARYLGFMLLEGEDLTVHGGRLMVRTIAGLKPISVLWRRLDANWSDPLELEESSHIGTPGLMGTVRNGNLTMINALGSGVLETRAFLAFLPRIAEKLTGEPLKMPSIATWWCGHESERRYVSANAERMTIGDAFSTRMVFDHADLSAVAGRLSTGSLEPVDEWIEANAGNLVGQELVDLSTTPAFGENGLEPRPMSLRVFLARTPDGWSVMPGGFARIASGSGQPALAMQEGSSTADVWVVSRSPVQPETMLSLHTSGAVTPSPGTLPSRAAENLYWLGRYVERCESATRLLRAWHVRLADMAPAKAPLLEYVRDHLEAFDIDPREDLSQGLGPIVQAATTAAGHVRDRLSADGWLALDDLQRTVNQLASQASAGEDAVHAANVLLRKISGFSGLVHENMYRFAGWRFLSIGRSIERAMVLSGLLAHLLRKDAPDGSLDLAVETADSFMTFRRRYPVSSNMAAVADLLALDPQNPRAVLYQLHEIDEHISELPGSGRHGRLSRLQRAVLDVRSNLELRTPETVDAEALALVGRKIAKLSDMLAADYFR
ncbi:circularly permuted type 2 ATP-grasp protein [Tepidamorphus sp. 3E244]|uniref:circularly permuted type 2 ATP-grasp protein n=1 Tax=Tepidamorphus sp. 3E244 TaxID=3385498 RepID=UPI0038FD0511